MLYWYHAFSKKKNKKKMKILRSYGAERNKRKIKSFGSSTSHNCCYSTIKKNKKKNTNKQKIYKRLKDKNRKT